MSIPLRRNVAKRRHPICPLRGRSPSYLARQLADLKQGTRHGLWSPLMAPVVASLTADDILNLAAYLSSLPPAK